MMGTRTRWYQKEGRKSFNTGAQFFIVFLFRNKTHFQPVVEESDSTDSCQIKWCQILVPEDTSE